MKLMGSRLRAAGRPVLGQMTAPSGSVLGMPAVTVLVGNPKPASRTLRAASAVAAALSDEPAHQIDLATFGPGLLDPTNVDVAAEVERVLSSELLIVASPTYKATYTGLLKIFLDRIGGDALAGTTAVPVMLAAARDHRLAVDVYLTPLLLELGASVPARGLFVLDSDIDRIDEIAAEYADRARHLIAAA
jgi:FMN reductase